MSSQGEAPLYCFNAKLRLKMVWLEFWLITRVYSKAHRSPSIGQISYSNLRSQIARQDPVDETPSRFSDVAMATGYASAGL